MSERVVISGVTKRFTGRITGRSGGRVAGVDAVVDVDLVVEPGDTLTVLGPSGCGKTTLLRMIAGLETPTSGSIGIGGEPPAAWRARKGIGFVPQAPALLPWRTVRANARLLLDINARARSTTGHPVDDLLADVGLADFLDAYPHELSGGMQQRVGLVRAFALDAPVLLMDEPFAALDEITRAEMRHLLAVLRARVGATVVFVTHSLAEAAFLSDQVAVMSARPGRVTELVPVTLARPRRPEVEDSAEFFELTTRLRHALHEASS